MLTDKSESAVTFNFKVKKTLDSIVKIIREHPEWKFSIEESDTKRVLRGKFPFYKFWVPPLRLELQLVEQNSAVLVKGKLFWAEIFHFIQNSLSIGSIVLFAIVFFGIGISAPTNNWTKKIIFTIIVVLFPVLFLYVIFTFSKGIQEDWKKQSNELHKQRFIDYLSDKGLLDS